MKNDPYFKKRIEYKLHGHEYSFDTANEIFSSFKVDQGSDLLLDTILRRDKLNYLPKKILDLGCGAGILGIVLADRFESAEVCMVDKDLLAVSYAKSNSKLNKVQRRCNAFGSIGIRELKDEKFDLIVSNIPAKIGDKAIEEEFILEPLNIIENKGSYIFVVVNSLNRLIPRISAKNELNIKKLSKRSGHTVYKVSI